MREVLVDGQYVDMYTREEIKQMEKNDVAEFKLQEHRYSFHQRELEKLRPVKELIEALENEKKEDAQTLRRFEYKCNRCGEIIKGPFVIVHGWDNPNREVMVNRLIPDHFNVYCDACYHGSPAKVLPKMSMDAQLEWLKKACMYLIGVSHDTNADKASFTWEGVSIKEKRIGNWNVTVRKITDSKELKKLLGENDTYNRIGRIQTEHPLK